MIDFFKKKSILCAGIALLLLTAVISIFDAAIAVGFLFVCLLTAITFFILFKLGVSDETICALFLITFFIHLAAVLFIYLLNFHPFGGGEDFEFYNQTAIEIAQRLGRGNFSLQGVSLIHYFPVLIGIVYAITLPQMIVGQLFTVWLAAFSIMLLYLLIIEIGGSKKAGFLIGLIASFYPSYLYFGSLLLKDTVVIPLVLGGILLSVKIVKNFTIPKFILFFIVLTGAIHLRFYVGFALLFSFIISWFLISNFELKKRIVYGIVMVILLGFSPFLLNYGYYGMKPLLGYINPRTITTYREVVYAPPPPPAEAVVVAPASSTPEIPSIPTNPAKPENKPANHEPAKSVSDGKEGYGSSFIIKAGFENPFTFVTNYIASFVCSLLGPFPWQLRFKRHLFFLLETVPWYFCFCFIIYGAYKFIKNNNFSQFLKHYQFTLPIILFCAMALGALSLYINNYGIIVRIRMPMFLGLLSVMSLSFKYVELKIGQRRISL